MQVRLCLSKLLVWSHSRCPSVQVLEAETLLNSLQVRHRLCNMLCPPFTKEDLLDNIIQGMGRTIRVTFGACICLQLDNLL